MCLCVFSIIGIQPSSASFDTFSKHTRFRTHTTHTHTETYITRIYQTDDKRLFLTFIFVIVAININHHTHTPQTTYIQPLYLIIIDYRF